MKMVIGLLAMLALSGCDGGATAAAPPAAKPAQGASMMVKVPTNDWLGRWTGPEGMFLDIAADGGPYSGRYTITNQYSLDDKGVFAGLASMDTIVFTRGGKREVLRAGNGDATGMKWLAGKKNCLIVAAGEGYCRE